MLTKAFTKFRNYVARKLRVVSAWLENLAKKIEILPPPEPILFRIGDKVVHNTNHRLGIVSKIHGNKISVRHLGGPDAHEVDAKQYRFR
jgi:hypothetical protein